MIPIILVIIAFAIAYSIVLTPAAARQQSRVPQFDSSRIRAKIFFSSLSDRFNTLLGKSSHKKSKEEEFRQWLNASMFPQRSAFFQNLPQDTACFTAWLYRLSEKDLHAFLKAVDDFCHAFDCSLSSLMDDRIHPSQRQLIEETVLLYCLAVWKGMKLEPWTMYNTWRIAPHKRKIQEFGNKLVLKLADRGLLAPVPPNLMTNSADRQAYLIQQVEKAAQENPQIFQDVLVIVVEELHGDKAPGRRKEKAANRSGASKEVEVVSPIPLEVSA